MEDWKKQFELVKKNAINIYSEEELVGKLKENRPLRVKLGVDPTAPDIHLGHTVVLGKLRQFQDLGHIAVLIIGDFTALIGDPSGKEKTRPQLTLEEIEKNVQTYLNQIGKILNLETLELKRNSEWLSKLGMRDILKLTSQVTVAQFIEREDFSIRFGKKMPIGLHEFLYPIMQGYDSVAIKADIELGGTDQTFNLLVGRDLQRAKGITPQVTMTHPLLVGLDGVNKMSKSLGNYIGVSEPPNEIFGKTMSISDKLMKDYYTLLTGIESGGIEAILKGHPRDAKMRLGKEIVTKYYSKKDADEAEQRFIQVISQQEASTDTPRVKYDKDKAPLSEIVRSCFFTTNSSCSNTQARTLINQGAVEVDGEKITDPRTEIDLTNERLIKIGKKNPYYRIKRQF
jgi:tyrosyl-tRNA synthetase